MKSKYITLGLAASSCALPFISSCEQTTENKRPNILLIVADDMGYSDLGCFGGEISTPNLDTLASHGIRYTQFYNMARSWPSRASIMTGYYYQAVRQSTAQHRDEGWSRAIPHYLSTNGYRSYHSGKWHIHELPKPCADAGFDHSYHTGHMFNHYKPRDFADDKPIHPDTTNYYQATVATDNAIRMLREHAKENPQAPFFLYLTYTTPHFPLQAPQKDIDKYKGVYNEGWDVLREQRLARMKKMGIADCCMDTMESHARWHYQTDEEILKAFGPGEVLEAVPWDNLTDEQKTFQSMKMEIHAAMVDHMDQEIGRVLQELKNNGQFDNTVILFLSDNGCSAEMMVRGNGHDPQARMGSADTHLCLGPGFATASNTPFRRSKIWVHEGGISTPLIVHWGNGINTKGELRNDPAHIIDLLPTILELGGVDPYEVTGNNYPHLHGVSLVPSFEKEGAIEREFIYFNHEGNYALRQGDWKVVSSEIDGKVWSLYNIAEDRGETNDLAGIYPERLKKMVAKWEELTVQYRAQNPRPTKPQLVDGFVKPKKL